MKRLLLALCALLNLVVTPLPASQAKRGTVLVLCYHDVPKQVDRDPYGVDRETFVQHIEYLRTHGYAFVSLDDMLKANRGEKTLPEKAVLLTFDDAYLSYYEFVRPLLEIYGYPSVLSVISKWVDNAPKDIRMPFMNWDQIREAAASDLVEIASHSDDLHRTILFTPQGNYHSAAVRRQYHPEKGTYESEREYRTRVYDDLARSKQELETRLDVRVRALVWPYGEYNGPALEEARRAGFSTTLVLDDLPSKTDNVQTITRCIVSKNPDITQFIEFLKELPNEPMQRRVLQADLDLLYDPDPDRQTRNINAFIERANTLKVNTVYLQAFCDEGADGNIASVYFPNRVLPMKADLFNHVANQLAIRGIEVYAWMPMLSIVLPDKAANERLRVREFKDGEKRLSGSWYNRLSPFCPDARDVIKALYEDMAVNARIAGVVFQDDGYLTDYEDFHPDAAAVYETITDDADVPFQDLRPEQQRSWMRLKTKTLIAFTEELKGVVKRYHPAAQFARTLYAPVLMEPRSESWFAQNFADTLDAYDFAVVMAYPRMEEVGDEEEWLRAVVAAAAKYPDGLRKTVFKIQAYDWEKEAWIDDATLNRWLRVLVASGARHIAYYPDNCLENKPEQSVIRLMISTEDFPFKRKLTQ